MTTIKSRIIIIAKSYFLLKTALFFSVLFSIRKTRIKSQKKPVCIE
jgi:hypothetical protein